MYTTPPTLQEASVPLGAVVGILDYIEKRRKSKKTSFSQQRSSTSGGYHQVMSHPPIYSPPDPISRSSAPSMAAYLTQHFQQPESPFPVIGSQMQAESAKPSPTYYSLASHYPQQSGQMMKPPQFEQLPPPTPQYPTSPHDQNLQQQQQFQYTQPPHQLPQSQQVNTNAPPLQHKQVASPSSLVPHHQLQYQQQQQPTTSVSSQAQTQAQVQQQLPQKPQQQVKAQEEVHPRLPLVSLPHSSSGSGAGSVATSPTTAQRRVTLPTAAVSQRGESV